MTGGLSLAIAAELPNPGIIALLGMGTVFICLTLIYLIMVLMSRFLGPTRVSAASVSAVPEASEEEAGDMGMPGADELQGFTGQDTSTPEIIAVIGAALGRHRKARAGAATPSAPEVVVNAWKLAARIHGHRRWHQR